MRHQAEQALQQNEQRFRSLIENSSDAISLLSPDGKLSYISPSTERILGYTSAESIGRDPLDFIHPDDQARILSVLSEVFQNPNTIFLAQYRMLHKDGSWRWIELAINNLLSELSVQAIVFNFRDVTTRKLNEEEIKTRAVQLESLNAIISAGSRGMVLKEFMEIALDHTLRAFNVNRGAIWLTDGIVVMRELSPDFITEIIETTRDNGGQIPQTTATNNWEHFPKNGPAANVAKVMSHFDIRADIVTPLLQNNVSIGGISVMSSEPRIWTGDEISLMESIGSQLGIIAERTRLFEETQRRVRELETVNYISTTLRTALSLEEILPLFLEKTLSVLQTTGGAIWLYDELAGRLRMMEQRGWFAPGQVELPSLKSGEGLAGFVFESDQVYRTADYKTDPHLDDATRQMIPSGQSGVGIPIRAAARPVGVLFINVPGPRELTSDEINLLTTLTEIAGNSIQRMKLHDRTEIQLQHLVALRAIDVAISSSFDLQFTLNILLDQVREQLSADAADILLLNPRLQYLEYNTGRGFNSSHIERSRLRLGEGLAGQSALERTPIYVFDNLRESRDFLRINLVNAERFVAYCVVPLIVKGQVKGVLEIFQRKALSSDPEWSEFLESLAGQAAIAIENNQLFESLQRSNTELALAYDATIEGWSKALDLRDEETEGHTQRVTELSMKLARAFGFDKSEMVYVRWGALLHDIGKMGVPDRVLLKPGPLTVEEWAIMKKHPGYAYDMLTPISYLRSAIDIPYCHHERWDGSGYPRGLKGESIPLAARIFAVVDVWDALRSDRPYRPAWPENEVRAYIREHAGTHFDPQIVDVFLKTIQQEG